MVQYFHLREIFRLGVFGIEANRAIFASTFLTETAAIWWFTLVRWNAPIFGC